VRLARIIGQVVSTVKDPAFEGLKLLLALPVDTDGAPLGQEALLVADGAQAGIGDYVLVCQEGKSARAVLGRPKAPCEAVVVGIVDYVETDGRQRALGPPAAEAKG
jgi:microcompartment protein CcmK/EutM